jgi:DNA modification methylase
MVTDPPYGVNYDPDWRNQALREDVIGGRAIGRVANDQTADWTKAWELYKGDVAYIWHASLYGNVVLESLQATNLMSVSQIVWAKPRFVIGRGDYHWQHECCLYCVRKGAPHRWNGARDQTTVWSISHIRSETGHSTQKPVECMARPMRNNSRTGEYVYDPFLGSGTSIIAAEVLDRRCLAIEINPAYVQVAVERWEKMTGKRATLDGKTTEQVRETRNTRIAVPGRDTGTAKKKSKIRRAGDARQPSKGRVAVRQPSAVAGNSR